MERQRPRRVALLLIGWLGLAMAASGARAESGPIEILVLKEHGVGSPSLAQPYVDRFVALAAEDNGWASAKGQYLSSRSAAETFIKAHSPHYGILSLAAFLALRERYQMEVLGRVASKLAGGEQYFIVSQVRARPGRLQGPQAGQRPLRRRAVRREGGRAARLHAGGVRAGEEPAPAAEPAAGAERGRRLRVDRRRPARRAPAPPGRGRP